MAKGSGSRKSKAKKSASPTPPATPKLSSENVTEQRDVIIDAQRLSFSEPNVLDSNQIKQLKEQSVFVPDDASSIGEREDEEGEHHISVLSSDVVAKNLSNLSTSAEGAENVYLSLNIAGYAASDISLLRDYPYLQKINLSYNALKDLSALNCMRHLVELQVSHNELTNLLDFNPARLGLRIADYSHNNISALPDLSEYCHLESLDVSHNQISKIEGLSACAALKTLLLSHNRVSNLSGLDGLSLRNFNLSHNQLSAITGLKHVRYLQHLNLSGNSIQFLSGLGEKPVLDTINLEDNCVSSLSELHHLQPISSLRMINLNNNPITEVDDYRKTVVYAMQKLTELDERPVTVDEKVAAVNLFDPPAEMQASLDHITHTVYSFLQPSRILESTLPSIEMPYPMLVLSGPRGSGKRELAHRLAQDFPDYFGFGVSHTTRAARKGEQDGKDYHFITVEHFQALVRQGAFVQTCKCAGALYGLTLDAIENVAKEGLACVVHMEINGVRTLKNTYLEPRYVLVLPITRSEHRMRMEERFIYSDAQIAHTVDQQAAMYCEIDRRHPGFFDMVINSDRLAEAYDRLRQLVMDYLGTGELTAADGETVIPRLSSADKDEQQSANLQHSGNMQRTWSRPSFVDSSTNGNDVTSAKPLRQRSPEKTPVEEASLRRRENAAKVAVEGYSPQIYNDLFRRPLVPMTAPGMLEGSPMAQAASLYQDPAFAANIFPQLESADMDNMQKVAPTPNGVSLRQISSPDSSNQSAADSSGFSGLSSARAFSLHQEKSKPNKEVADQALDLSALNDTLESLKGSFKESQSQITTPLAPRDSTVGGWIDGDVVSMTTPQMSFGANIKPILPPIPVDDFK